MDAPTPAAYADFVSNLYEANGGNLSIHIRELCENSSNVIVHHLAAETDLEIPDMELNTLAERFALERGGRSARLARQFVDGLLAR